MNGVNGDNQWLCSSYVLNQNVFVLFLLKLFLSDNATDSE